MENYSAVSVATSLSEEHGIAIMRLRKWSGNVRRILTREKKHVMPKRYDDAVLKDAFVRVFNRMKEDKGNFIETLNQNIEKVLAG